jgi:hypothetical protein
MSYTTSAFYQLVKDLSDAKPCEPIEIITEIYEYLNSVYYDEIQHQIKKE